MRPGLQLYSIKDQTEKDMLGALERVAQIGYENVEFAGYRDISAKDMKAALTKLGLRSSGTHANTERLMNNFEEELAYNAEIGSKYIICPGIKLDTLDDIKIAAELFNKCAQRLSGTGMKMGYHNHDPEFRKIDGKYILDLLMEQTSPEVVFELDVYWASVADVDPVEYIKTRDRIELIHCKEMLDYQSKKNAPVGSGVLDFPTIIKEAKLKGAQEFIVEQEDLEGDIWENITSGFNHINGLDV